LQEKSTYDLQLVQLLSTVRSVPLPQVGLAPPKQSSRPQIETRNTIDQWIFCQFLKCQAPPPAQTQSPPIENFLVTVQMKQEFKYFRVQWHGQPKILGESKSFILGK